MGLSVSEALATRHSIRGFLSKPVGVETINNVLTKASRAPSGGNLQPWKVYALAGQELTAFKEIMARRIQEAPMGESPFDYEIYPKELKSPYRDYRFKVGEDLYGHLGISRDNKLGRLLWFAKNFQFFGAPTALFFYLDRQMGPPQWSDMGMYIQSVMLLLREEGLDSCAQECWSLFHKTVADFLNPPPELMLFCGMAIGYKDPDEAANQLIAERAPLEDFAIFRGF